MEVFLKDYEDLGLQWLFKEDEFKKCERVVYTDWMENEEFSLDLLYGEIDDLFDEDGLDEIKLAQRVEALKKNKLYEIFKEVILGKRLPKRKQSPLEEASVKLRRMTIDKDSTPNGMTVATDSNPRRMTFASDSSPSLRKNVSKQGRREGGIKSLDRKRKQKIDKPGPDQPLIWQIWGKQKTTASVPRALFKREDN